MANVEAGIYRKKEHSEVSQLSEQKQELTVCLTAGVNNRDLCQFVCVCVACVCVCRLFGISVIFCLPVLLLDICLVHMMTNRELLKNLINM